jgi:hypothetical protein
VGGWQFLAYSALGSAGDINVAFSAREHLMIEWLVTTMSVSTVPSLRFNGDTGANYARRNTDFTGTVAASSSTGASRVELAETSHSGDNWGVAQIFNQATKVKRLVGHGQYGSGSAAAAPIDFLVSAVWSNTTDQITSLQLDQTSSGDIGAGSYVLIMGRNNS